VWVIVLVSFKNVTMPNCMDLESLRKKIDSGEITFKKNVGIIESGQLVDVKDKSSTYEIAHGWDIVTSVQIDREWGAYYLRLFEIIKSRNYSEKEIEEIFSKIQNEDVHWDWFNKSVAYREDCYNWFYLIADEKPQGACLIYHPKSSLIDSNDIFYIEFVAVAPWNRSNPIIKKKYKGVGTILIKCALKFSIDALGLKPGFSLNALPQAEEYYKRIGMLRFPEKDNGKLIYFEMPRKTCAEMIGKP